MHHAYTNGCTSLSTSSYSIIHYNISSMTLRPALHTLSCHVYCYSFCYVLYGFVACMRFLISYVCMHVPFIRCFCHPWYNKHTVPFFFLNTDHFITSTHMSHLKSQPSFIHTYNLITSTGFAECTKAGKDPCGSHTRLHKTFVWPNIKAHSHNKTKSQSLHTNTILCGYHTGLFQPQYTWINQHLK